MHACMRGDRRVIIQRRGIHNITTILQRLCLIIILWRHTYKPCQFSNYIWFIKFSWSRYLTSLRNENSGIFNAAIHQINAKNCKLFPSVPLVETEYLAIALLAYCNACFICFHVCGWMGSIYKEWLCVDPLFARLNIICHSRNCH